MEAEGVNLVFSINFQFEEFDVWRPNRKSKSLSEVKSFSSFSFSDVALDYKLVTSKNGKLSQSDPSKLDREQSLEVKN